MSEKPTKRDAIEAGAIATAGVATGYVARHGVITKRGEFSALLREKAPLDKLESHPHLQRSVKRMAKIPDTQKLKGFGTPEFFGKRTYKVDGQKVRGADALIGHLEKMAPNLGYTDAGMKAPKTSPLKSERVATIVTGPPASGKSTVANEIARRTNAALVDSDVVKKSIKGFKGGIGANAVHEESSILSKRWLAAHVAKGDNIVLPRVGDNAQKLAADVNRLREAGYKVNVTNVHVPPDVSMTRMLRRFDRSGRLVNPEYVRGIGLKPAAAVEHVAKQGLASIATVDMSKDKPPRPPASGVRAALKGQDPRTLQGLSRTAGKVGFAVTALAAAAKVYDLATRGNGSQEAKGGPAKSAFQKADGQYASRDYSEAQQAAFKARRKGQ